MRLQPATCSRCCHETFLYQVSYILSFHSKSPSCVLKSHPMKSSLSSFMYRMRRPEASKEATTAANVVGPRVGQQRDAVACPQEVQLQRPHRMQNLRLKCKTMQQSATMTSVNQVVADEAVQDVNVFIVLLLNGLYLLSTL